MSGGGFSLATIQALTGCISTPGIKCTASFGLKRDSRFSSGSKVSWGQSVASTDRNTIVQIEVLTVIAMPFPG